MRNLCRAMLIWTFLTAFLGACGGEPPASEPTAVTRAPIDRPAGYLGRWGISEHTHVCGYDVYTTAGYIDISLVGGYYYLDRSHAPEVSGVGAGFYIAPEGLNMRAYTQPASFQVEADYSARLSPYGVSGYYQLLLSPSGTSWGYESMAGTVGGCTWTLSGTMFPS